MTDCIFLRSFLLRDPVRGSRFLQIYIVRFLKNCSLTIFTRIACISTLCFLCLKVFFTLCVLFAPYTWGIFRNAAGPSLPVYEAAVVRVVELSFCHAGRSFLTSVLSLSLASLYLSFTTYYPSQLSKFYLCLPTT